MILNFIYLANLAVNAPIVQDFCVTKWNESEVDDRYQSIGEDVLQLVGGETGAGRAKSLVVHR